MSVDRTAKEKAWDEGVAFGWKSASGLIQTHRDMQEKATRRAEELEAENARLREEWAQEGIGWLRDKDIDRLMGVEEENKLLRERLEDKTNSLRVEVAAKQGAHNEIRIMEMALRRAVRALDEGHIIRPGSQIYCDLMDALPEN